MKKNTVCYKFIRAYRNLSKTTQFKYIASVLLLAKKTLSLLLSELIVKLSPLCSKAYQWFCKPYLFKKFPFLEPKLKRLGAFGLKHKKPLKWAGCLLLLLIFLQSFSKNESAGFKLPDHWNEATVVAESHNPKAAVGQPIRKVLIKSPDFEDLIIVSETEIIDSEGSRQLIHEEYIANDLLISIETAEMPDDLLQIIKKSGATITDDLGDGMYVLETSTSTLESIEKLKAELNKSGLCKTASVNNVLHAQATPNDPEFSQLWGMKKISAPKAWKNKHSASQVVVAVIDTGVRFSHVDLASNMWKNPNETPGNGVDDDRNGYIDDVYGIDAIKKSAPMDIHGHGTHCAGTIGAVGNNGKGITGVAWDVNIMALKYASGRKGEIINAIKCINYAIKQKAHIINASWGFTGHENIALKRKIISARNAGIIFVAAAGNDKSNNDKRPHYPSNYNLDNIVAVAASTPADTLASFSNYGERSVDIAAPGQAIYSTGHKKDNSYTVKSGTSMAAPHVAGSLAILKAAYPADNYRELLFRLYNGATLCPSLIKSSTGKFQTAMGRRLNLDGALAAPKDAVADKRTNSKSTENTAVKQASFEFLQRYSGGRGTKDDPYLIGTKEDVLEFSKCTTKEGLAILSKEITAQLEKMAAEFQKRLATITDPEISTQMMLENSDFTQKRSKQLFEQLKDNEKCFRVIADINMAGSKFTRCVSEGFSGSFDGRGHTISNVEIKTTDSVYNVGFFAYLGQGAKVHDLALEKIKITNSGDAKNVGGLVGEKYSGFIENCYVSGSISVKGKSEAVGGLLGENNRGHVINSAADVTIRVGDNALKVGGLCGFSPDDIQNSHAKGTVFAGDNAEFIGGFCGKSHGSKECYATGDVSCGNNASSVGGLSGSDSSPFQCYASGSVTVGEQSKNIGGLCGAAHETVKECSATGLISAGVQSKFIGGLCGNSYGKIENSFSTGAIAGKQLSNVGGICGNSSSLSKCYSLSKIDIEANRNCEALRYYGRNNLQLIADGKIDNNCTVRDIDSFWNYELYDFNSNQVEKVWTNNEGAVVRRAKSASAKTTEELKDKAVYLSAGWNLADETSKGASSNIWVMDGYPKLACWTVSSVKIVGSGALTSDQSAKYQCMATYANGETRPVSGICDWKTGGGSSGKITKLGILNPGDSVLESQSTADAEKLVSTHIHVSVKDAESTPFNATKEVKPLEGSSHTITIAIIDVNIRKSAEAKSCPPYHIAFEPAGIRVVPLSKSITMRNVNGFQSDFVDKFFKEHGSLLYMADVIQFRIAGEIDSDALVQGFSLSPKAGNDGLLIHRRQPIRKLSIIKHDADGRTYLHEVGHSLLNLGDVTHKNRTSKELMCQSVNAEESIWGSIDLSEQDREAMRKNVSDYLNQKASLYEADLETLKERSKKSESEISKLRAEIRECKKKLDAEDVSSSEKAKIKKSIKEAEASLSKEKLELRHYAQLIGAVEAELEMLVN